MPMLLEKKSVMTELRKLMDGRTQRVVAAELGISQQYLADILKENRDLGEAVLRKLGFERVIRFRRIA
jgi:transcriptional regulator with XRE-family HTH domain